MKKKQRIGILSLILCASTIFAFSSCGKAKYEAVTLNEDEKEIIEAVKNDIKVITDDDYAENVTEYIAHTGVFTGTLCQLEGVYTVEDGVSYVSRTLVHDGEKTAANLPLKDVGKEIENGAWIRVMGIITTIEINGEEVSALEVLTVEGLTEKGKEELSWNGSAHSH